MKFAYELGGEVTMQEQQAKAIFHVGRVTTTPTARIVVCDPPVCASVDVTIGVKVKPTTWDRIKKRWRGFLEWFEALIWG